MMLLCVDGIDPDLVHEYKWGNLFKYNYKLEIPKECFVPDSELGSTPHTTRVWPTIFSGQLIDYGSIRRKGIRSIAHDLLVKAGITWKRSKPKYTVNPYNEDIDTIFDQFDSFAWNIPTITPEWIATFPNYPAVTEYCRREFQMWLMMTVGSLTDIWELEAYYTRYLDFVGHKEYKKLRSAYQTIFSHISTLKRKRDDVIVLSDHGCKNGLHTNYAYLGSDEPFEAESVHELRKDFEKILEGPA
ncbi:MAG: hypothetical protein ACW99F_03795 [Candidatus Hodarchaeales archaeon]|jgi:hypothetical protein